MKFEDLSACTSYSKLHQVVHPFFSSMTTLKPSLSDSSLRWLIPVIFLSLTNNAIDSISFALLT